MARSLFGGRPGDFVIVDPSTNANVVKVAPSLTSGTVWSAATGGTQYTSLLTAGGSAITTISSDASGGIVTFQGPDGIRTLWVDFGGSRRLLESQTVAADLANAAQTAAIAAASADATAKANTAQANAIAATAGLGTPIVQNSDGSLPSRLTVTTDRTRVLLYRLVRTDIAITTSTTAGSTLPTPDDIFFFRA